MMAASYSQKCSTDSEIPDIVQIVISRLTRLRALGQITAVAFAAQIRRLEREELKRLGFCLTVAAASTGCVSYYIQHSRTGEVHQSLQFSPEGLLEAESLPLAAAV